MSSSCSNSCISSCSGICAVSGITVCFPAKQIIPDGTYQDNPFYDIIHQRSFWSYSIAAASEAKGFEHWALPICSQLATRKNKQDFSIEFSDNNGASFKAVKDYKVTTHENLINFSNYIRINESQAPGTCFLYRITIQNPDFFNLEAEPGSIVVRSPKDKILFDPNRNCSNSPLLTPSVNSNKVPVSSLPQVRSGVGGCEKILARKVAADQIFICRNTISGLGSNLDPSDEIANITFTLRSVDCQPVFDTVSNQVGIDMAFTLDLNVAIIPETDSFTASGVQVICSGTFCGLSPDMFSTTERAMVECELLRIVNITHSGDKIVNNALTTNITILSKFVLLQKEILVVALCPHKNVADAVIPDVTCNGRRDRQEIIEELQEKIRREIKSLV